MNERNKNKGFSLIELIVTIAVMAIVTGATMSIYSWIKSHRLKSMAENVNDAIGDLRSITLSKGGKYQLVIRKDGNDYIAVIQTGNTQPDGTVIWTDMREKTTIGSKGDIYFDDAGTSTRKSVSDTVQIIIQYTKADGSFSSIKWYDTAGGDGFIDNNKINVKYAGEGKIVNLVELTGKHFITNN